MLSKSGRSLPAERRPTVSSHEASIRRLYEGVWNDTEPSVADSLVHEDYLIHDRDLADDLRGPELYRALASGTREIFPDASFAIEDLLQDGNRVAVRWTMTGTHEGSMAGEEPTGNRVELAGIEINRFADGALVETWIQSDQVGLMEQVGALPDDQDST
jgi:predicted ester cyclase